MADKLKVNDRVLWRGAWGTEPEQIATVVAMEVNCVEKYGIESQEVEWRECRDRSVVVSLDNGHWAYGNQLAPLPPWL
jgi:hypothetical protein